MINHLLSGPIDTIGNGLHKLSKCQKLANYWKDFPAELETLNRDEEDLDHKTLTIVTDAYVEWGYEHRAREYL